MAHFLAQVGYSPEGWQALVKSPQNRIEAVRPAIEKLGGKIETGYFAFGEYDLVLVFQMPDNVMQPLLRWLSRREALAAPSRPLRC